MSQTFTQAAEALSASKLDWIAQEESLISQTGVSIESHKAIIRSDTRASIGIVGKNWTPIQNSDAFAFFDTICQDKGAKYIKAKDYYGGSRISLTAKLGQADVNSKVGDIVENRISLINSFDGTSGFKVRMSPFRLVCKNGLVREESSGSVYCNLKHTKNVRQRYQDALTIFNVAQENFKVFVEEARFLGQKIIDRDLVIRLIRDTFEVPSNLKKEEIPTRTVNNMNQVFTLFHKGLGNQGKTAWDFVNAVAEYTDHHVKSDENDAEIYSIFGQGSKMKERSYALAMALRK